MYVVTAPFLYIYTHTFGKDDNRALIPPSSNTFLALFLSFFLNLFLFFLSFYFFFAHPSVSHKYKLAQTCPIHTPTNLFAPNIFFFFVPHSYSRQIKLHFPSLSLSISRSLSAPFIYDFSRNREHPFTKELLQFLVTSYPTRQATFRYWFTMAICKITPGALKLSITARSTLLHYF